MGTEEIRQGGPWTAVSDDGLKIEVCWLVKVTTTHIGEGTQTSIGPGGLVDSAGAPLQRVAKGQYCSLESKKIYRCHDDDAP